MTLAAIPSCTTAVSLHRGFATLASDLSSHLLHAVNPAIFRGAGKFPDIDLLSAHNEVISKALRTPFVIQLALGVLPRRDYENFLAQEHYFLASSIRTYDIALQRFREAPSEERKGAEHLKELFISLRDSAVREHKMITAQQTQKWSKVPSPACLEYSNYLYAIASRGHLSTLPFAFFPCAITYHIMGSTLKAMIVESTAEAHPYKTFFNNYSSDKFSLSVYFLNLAIKRSLKAASLGNEIFFAPPLHQREELAPHVRVMRVWVTAYRRCFNHEYRFLESASANIVADTERSPEKALELHSQKLVYEDLIRRSAALPISPLRHLEKYH